MTSENYSEKFRHTYAENENVSTGLGKSQGGVKCLVLSKCLEVVTVIGLINV